MSTSPRYDVIGREIRTGVTGEWIQRPYHVVGYALVAIAFITGFTLVMVYLSTLPTPVTGSKTAGFLILMFGDVLLLVLAVVRCCEINRNDSDMIAVV